MRTIQYSALGKYRDRSQYSCEAAENDCVVRFVSAEDGILNSPHAREDYE